MLTLVDMPSELQGHTWCGQSPTHITPFSCVSLSSSVKFFGGMGKGEQEEGVRVGDRYDNLQAPFQL